MPRFGPMYRVHDAWAFGVWHLIFTLLVLAVVVLLAIWLIRSFQHTHPVGITGQPVARSSAETALHEARMRYARGELTREQFAQISSDLGTPLPPAAGPPTES